MSTIPQRLREIAVDVGQQNMAAYVKLRAIAAELEAPAAEGSLALASESRRGSVAFQYLREEVARAMAPVYAAFANQTKAEKPAADVVPVVEMDANEWAELYRLREAMKGPAGYETWQDAATAERRQRVLAERDHLASVTALQARVKSLEAENFALAAGQCIVPGGLCGDEGGNQYCSLQRAASNAKTHP